MNAHEIMDLIRSEMKRQHISLHEMGRRVGASPSNVKYWLDKGGIPLEKAGKVLDALGLEISVRTKERIKNA